jgi:hypothetical protein
LFNGQPLVDRHLNEGDEVGGHNNIDQCIHHVVADIRVRPFWFRRMRSCCAGPCRARSLNKLIF